MSVRVLLADDQVLIRSGFAALIGSCQDIVVVGEASDGAEALEQVNALRPDVVLLDIRMPGMDGLSAARHISASPELNEVKIIVLTTFEADEYVLDALRAGASGFLGKSVEPEELLDAIRVVARGMLCCHRAPPAASSLAFSPLRPPPQQLPEPPPLPPRPPRGRLWEPPQSSAARPGHCRH